jgi:peptide/bleomycin uptake transporter
VQEDTNRFASIMEDLGISFVRSVMTLLAFLPILWSFSAQVKVLPWIGAVPQALVWVAIVFALCGTVLLAMIGFKLPGLQFQNQKVEAAYRKELVYGEDDQNRATGHQLGLLFREVRRNYFRLFFHYMYFDVAKWSYLQVGVMVPYIAMGPTLVAGGITLGIFQQVVRAFGRVESSFQYLVNSWTTVIELISVYKRLRAFERVVTHKDKSGLVAAG